MNPLQKMSAPTPFNSPLLGGPGKHGKSGKAAVLTTVKEELQAKPSGTISKAINWFATKLTESKFKKLENKIENMKLYQDVRPEFVNKQAVDKLEGDISKLEHKLSKSIEKLSKLPYVKKLAQEQRLKLSCLQAQRDISTFHKEIKDFQKGVRPGSFDELRERIKLRAKDIEAFEKIPLPAEAEINRNSQREAQQSKDKAKLDYPEQLREKFAAAQDNLNQISADLKGADLEELSKALQKELDEVKTALETLEASIKTPAPRVEVPVKEIAMDLDQIGKLEQEIKGLKRDLAALQIPEENEDAEFKTLRESTLEYVQNKLKTKEAELRRLENP